MYFAPTSQVPGPPGVLIMRYFKRVNAHLKNSATSVINPFHEIGFRPGAI